MWPVSLSSSSSVDEDRLFLSLTHNDFFFISLLKLFAFRLPLSIFDIRNFLYHPTIPMLILLKPDLELAPSHASSSCAAFSS